MLNDAQLYEIDYHSFCRMEGIEPDSKNVEGYTYERWTDEKLVFVEKNSLTDDLYRAQCEEYFRSISDH